jgi:hypothetical protein
MDKEILTNASDSYRKELYDEAIKNLIAWKYVENNSEEHKKLLNLRDNDKFLECSQYIEEKFSKIANNIIKKGLDYNAWGEGQDIQYNNRYGIMSKKNQNYGAIKRYEAIADYLTNLNVSEPEKTTSLEGVIHPLSPNDISIFQVQTQILSPDPNDKLLGLNTAKILLNKCNERIKKLEEEEKILKARDVLVELKEVDPLFLTAEKTLPAAPKPKQPKKKQLETKEELYKKLSKEDIAKIEGKDENSKAQLIETLIDFERKESKTKAIENTSAKVVERYIDEDEKIVIKTGTVSADKEKESLNPTAEGVILNISFYDVDDPNNERKISLREAYRKIALDKIYIDAVKEELYEIMAISVDALEANEGKDKNKKTFTNLLHSFKIKHDANAKKTLTEKLVEQTVKMFGDNSRE